MLQTLKLQPCLRLRCMQHALYSVRANYNPNDSQTTPPVHETPNVHQRLKIPNKAAIHDSNTVPKPIHKPYTSLSNSVKPDAPESKLWNIPPGLLSYHYETTPPTIDQLEHAQAFFERNPKEFMYSSPKFKLMDFDESPEVCFLGRSNVGKSSLMNAILDKQMAKTSFKPGKTRMLNLFVVGPKHGRPEDKLVILDTPGYGHGSRDDWGVQIMKYLEKRRQLKMAFLLIDATHGMKNSDHQLINMFRERRIPFQVVFSKVDRMLFDQKSTPGKVVLEGRIANLQEEMMNVRQVIDPRKGEHGWEPWMDEEESIVNGEIIGCMGEKIRGKRYGVDAVRFAMLKAAGLEQAPVLGKVRLQEIVPFDQISGFNE